MGYKYIILFLSLLLGPSSLANEEFTFVNEYVDVFTELNIATIRIKNTLETQSDVEILKTELLDYNNVLTSAQNKFSKYVGTENLLLEKITSDLKRIISDLILRNKKHLKFLNKSRLSSKKVSKRNLVLLMNHGIITENLSINAIGIRTLLLYPNSDPDSEKFASALTLKQRDSLSLKLHAALSYKNSGCSSLLCSCYSDFEHSLRLIYVYINQPIWEFKKQ